MCGISGIVGPSSSLLIKRMLNRIKHRGPDGTGIVELGEACFGHVRLSIIDLEGGLQPMLSNDLASVITFNGEIYNYKELRNTLEYNFKTNSDTEVILALYRKFKDKFLNNLSGMFSFAIYDNISKSLFCARDRFGEKPFYYAIGREGQFIFASELKAITSTGLVSLELNLDSVAHYVQHLYTPPYQTIYKNVHVLPPGHKLIFINNKLQVSKYWDLPPIRSISYTDAINTFDDLLTKSVKSQLVSDVEVGAFLSGGLDSSTIVSLMSKFRSDFKTFSFGFKSEGKSELHYAKEVSNLYRTNHIELEEDGHDIAALILKMNEIYDEPFADSSNIPTYLLSSIASKHLKVVLGGDGADELLGGYVNWYRPITHFGNKPPNVLNSLRYKVLYKILRRFQMNENNRVFYQSKLLEIESRSPLNARLLQNWYFTPSQIKGMGIQPFFSRTDIVQTHDVNDAMLLDTIDYLPGDILVKSDRAAMSCGLEVRSPFLDRELTDFLLSLPSDYKISRTEDKILLRNTYSNDWPKSIRTRTKQGFGADVSLWMNNPGVIDLKETYLNDKNKKINNLLNLNNIKDCTPYQEWILLILSIWLETHDYQV